MRSADPARMSAADRLAELGELLAAGVQRLLARGIKVPNPTQVQQEALDAVAGVEAPCGPPTERTR